MNKPQRNWSPTEKECFALLLGTREWEIYSIPRPITLISDHNPLVWLRQQKDPRRKYAGWITELEQVQYSTVYKKVSQT